MRFSKAVLCVVFGMFAVGAVGCSSSADDGVTESADKLSSDESALVGAYATDHPTKGGIGKLTLKADGSYIAFIDVPLPADSGLVIVGDQKVPQVDAQFGVCVSPPCQVGELGGWAASKSSEKLTLELYPNGTDPRSYTVERTADSLVLTGPDNVVQTLRVGS